MKNIINFAWYNKKINIATLEESQLEEFIKQFKGTTLKQDLYYEDRLLLKSNNYFSERKSNRLLTYYENKKEQEMPTPYQLYQRQKNIYKYAA